VQEGEGHVGGGPGGGGVGQVQALAPAAPGDGVSAGKLEVELGGDLRGVSAENRGRGGLRRVQEWKCEEQRGRLSIVSTIMRDVQETSSTGGEEVINSPFGGGNRV
jgi:hypothetical protein